VISRHLASEICMRAFAAYSLVLCAVVVAGCSYAVIGNVMGDLAIMLGGLMVVAYALALIVLGVLVYGSCLIVERLCAWAPRKLRAV
jgi:hypothetical protein